jgi:hypothetical protein
VQSSEINAEDTDDECGRFLIGPVKYSLPTKNKSCDRRNCEVRVKIKNSLPKMTLGAVCAQLIRCGKPNCKCARGELHGPYFYRFVRAHGALVKRYVKAQNVALVRAICDARRDEVSRHRQSHKLNACHLIKAIEQLRENERFLSSLRR